MERLESQSSGLSILVIEDEEAILRGPLDVLAFPGYVSEAENAAGRQDELNLGRRALE